MKFAWPPASGVVELEQVSLEVFSPFPTLPRRPRDPEFDSFTFFAFWSLPFFRPNIRRRTRLLIRTRFSNDFPNFFWKVLAIFRNSSVRQKLVCHSGRVEKCSIFQVVALSTCTFRRRPKCIHNPQKQYKKSTKITLKSDAITTSQATCFASASKMHF